VFPSLSVVYSADRNAIEPFLLQTYFQFNADDAQNDNSVKSVNLSHLTSFNVISHHIWRNNISIDIDINTGMIYSIKHNIFLT
jgi:hypothetical protein